MLHIILYIKNPVLKRRDVRQYGKLYVKNCNHRLQRPELGSRFQSDEGAKAAGDKQAKKECAKRKICAIIMKLIDDNTGPVQGGGVT